ncbi:MAG: hypothetical protein R3F21_11240 [Myxococcota bacterium]
MRRTLRIVRFAVAFGVALALSACGQRGVQLFTHPNPKVPNLHGATVAAFPPLSLSEERGASILALQTLDAVFAAEISGIRFLPPTEVVAQTELSEEEAALLARQMSEFLPIDVEPKRGKARLFSRRRLGDLRLPDRLVVTLQRDPYPKRQLSPAALPTSFFSGLTADYALLTVTFPGYHRISRTAAMLGIVPLAFVRELRADGPRSLFALYEVASGARVWDVIVGVDNRVRPADATAARRRIMDYRMMPVVGVAYLLTGDVEIPLERAIRPRMTE